jgi:DNA modification methylase
VRLRLEKGQRAPALPDNVWDYAGVNTMKVGRMDELATVKPVALVADAISDCSKRGEAVLDCFAGSGTTLIAAEKCGRLACLVEFDPVLVCQGEIAEPARRHCCRHELRARR